MATSTYCSLNILSPPSSLSPPSRTTQISCLPTPRERSWKNKCLLGLTWAIIGLEVSDFTVLGDQERSVLAVDMKSGSTRVSRWSDKRACQPWRVNSLETIVPENLPRPSARRRWEATGFSRAAPPLKVVVKSGDNSCFNL